jgi:hypothetical protein
MAMPGWAACLPTCGDVMVMMMVMMMMMMMMMMMLMLLKPLHRHLRHSSSRARGR